MATRPAPERAATLMAIGSPTAPAAEATEERAETEREERVVHHMDHSPSRPTLAAAAETPMGPIILEAAAEAR